MEHEFMKTANGIANADSTVVWEWRILALWIVFSLRGVFEMIREWKINLNLDCAECKVMDGYFRPPRTIEPYLEVVSPTSLDWQATTVFFILPEHEVLSIKPTITEDYDNNNSHVNSMPIPYSEV